MQKKISKQKIVSEKFEQVFDINKNPRLNRNQNICEELGISTIQWEA